MRVLFAGAELFPWVKVGGLGDVMASLPPALRERGVDVRLLIPGYPAVMRGLTSHEEVWFFRDLFGGGEARLRLGTSPAGVPVYVLDCPGFFDREGDPYAEWGDSHRRFAAFSFAAAHLATHGDGRGFRPDVLSCHDWQTGLAPVWIADSDRPDPVPTVITVHNLAYQGVYSSHLLPELHLPEGCFHPGGVEFHGQVSFLKAGLAYARMITTVSPTYAREIQEPAGGFGLDGLLAHRRADLVGILNGIDDQIWNPTTSPDIAVRYDAATLDHRIENKRELQRQLGLYENPERPIFAIISRLADIKGLDLVLANIDHMMALDCQLVVLGRGDHMLESRFRELERYHARRIVAWIGYDEGLAHRVFAGTDVVMVPSRSEPCGLTQMYAMRYGAVPLVRRTGGLADTVVDASDANVANGTATGFTFDRADSFALGDAISRAHRLYHESPATWQALQKTGMERDWSWRVSADRYVEVYRSMVARRG